MRRRGFTLTELLTIVAIITLLIQLMLPAVFSAKESARRTACQNNLRQIALAAQLHVGATERFPTGGWHWNWVGDPDRGHAERQPGGWIYNLLPYLEMNAIHGLGKGAHPESKLTFAADLQRTPLSLFTCPTRRRAVAYPTTRPDDTVNSAPTGLQARSDYAANAGDLFLPTGFGPDSFTHAESPDFDWRDMSRMTGICFLRSMVRTQDVTDGLSHTYFAGEKYLDKAEYKAGGDYGDDMSMYSGSDFDVLRWTSPTANVEYFGIHDQPNHPRQDEAGTTAGLAFGSAHAPGWNVVLCDGSVMLIAYGVDPNVHRDMGTRSAQGQ